MRLCSHMTISAYHKLTLLKNEEQKLPHCRDNLIAKLLETESQSVPIAHKYMLARSPILV